MAIKLTSYQKWKQTLVIISGAIRGIGANKTLAILKSIGLGIRRTVGLARYRAYAGVPAKEEAIKYTPKQFMIGRGMYTEAFGVMTRRYRYTVASEFYDKATGELKKYYTSMISDRPMSVGEMERVGGDVLRGLAKMYDATITRQWVHKAEHREGDPWD